MTEMELEVRVRMFTEFSDILTSTNKKKLKLIQKEM